MAVSIKKSFEVDDVLGLEEYVGALGKFLAHTGNGTLTVSREVDEKLKMSSLVPEEIAKKNTKIDVVLDIND